jgi:hypothetical protein
MSGTIRQSQRAGVGKGGDRTVSLFGQADGLPCGRSPSSTPKRAKEGRNLEARGDRLTLRLFRLSHGGWSRHGLARWENSARRRSFGLAGVRIQNQKYGGVKMVVLGH